MMNVGMLTEKKRLNGNDMNRKIELMHDIFGIDEEHKCGECDNFGEHRYDKLYYKCAVYGISSSEASDWRKKYTACGMFNKEYTGRPIIELRKHAGGMPAPEPELDGQVKWEV